MFLLISNSGGGNAVGVATELVILQPTAMTERNVNRSGIAVGCSALLGFVIVFQSYDYISLFVSCFDVPVSLGSLF